MSFNLRYSGHLGSRDGLAYQARLLQDGGSGSPEQVVLTDSPLTVTWGRKGSDVYVPILASKAEVQNWRLASALEAGYGTGELADLIGARVGEWRLEVRRAASHATINSGGGDLYWVGQVLTDAYQDSTMTGPSRVDVQAIDGISTLKEKPYYDTTSTPGERLPYEGAASFLTIAQRALAPLGYALPLRSAIAWRPVGESAEPLASVHVDQAAFYSELGEAMSCYDVLSEVCRRLGARLCQHAETGDEAAWWIVSRELMDGSAFTASRYTAAGVADGTMSAGAGVAVGVEDGPARLSGNRTFRPAYGAVSVLHNHGTVYPLVTEGIEDEGLRIHRIPIGRKHITIRQPLYSTEWTYTGDAQATETPPREVTKTGINRQYSVAERNFVHAVGSIGIDVAEGGFEPFDPEDVKGEVVTAGNYATTTGREIGIGQIIAFSGSVNIQSEDDSEALYNTYWTVGIEGTNWVMRRDGGWSNLVVAATRAQYLVQPGASTLERGIRLDTDVAFQFVSEPAPAAGAVTVRLYGSSGYFVLSGSPAAGDVWWDNASVIVANAEGNALGATRTELWALETDGSPRPDPARDEVVLRTGQGPAQSLPTTILWGTAPANAAVTGDWQNSLGLSGSLDVVTAGTMLRSQFTPLASLQETYRDSADIIRSPIAPVVKGGEAHAPQYLARDVYHGQAEGEWVRVAYDPALPVEAESGGEDPASTTYVPSIGSAGGAGNGAGTGTTASVPPSRTDTLTGGPGVIVTPETVDHGADRTRTIKGDPDGVLPLSGVAFTRNEAQDDADPALILRRGADGGLEFDGDPIGGAGAGELTASGGFGVTVNDQPSVVLDLSLDTALAIKTPQDLRTTGTPQFARSGIGRAADGSSALAVGSAGTKHYGNQQSDHWSDGLTGYRITRDGAIDARSGHFDELTADLFTANVIEVRAGTTYITKSKATTSRPFTVPTVGAWSYLYVSDLPELGNTQVYGNGDSVLLQIFNRDNGGLIAANVWGRVTSYTDQPNGEQRYVFTTKQVALGVVGQVVPKGAVGIDFGQSGDSYIEFTVVGANAPYSQTVRWTDTTGNYVPDTFQILERHGRIDGVSTPGLTKERDGIVARALYAYKDAGSLVALDSTQARVRLNGRDVVTSTPGGELYLQDGTLVVAPQSVNFDAVTRFGYGGNLLDGTFSTGPFAWTNGGIYDLAPPANVTGLAFPRYEGDSTTVGLRSSTPGANATTFKRLEIMGAAGTRTVSLISEARVTSGSDVYMGVGLVWFDAAGNAFDLGAKNYFADGELEYQGIFELRVTDFTVPPEARSIRPYLQLNRSSTGASRAGTTEVDFLEVTTALPDYSTEAATDAAVAAAQEALVLQMGYESFADFVAQAIAGETLIIGGLVNTQFINTVALLVRNLSAAFGTIQSAVITESLTTPGGGFFGRGEMGLTSGGKTAMLSARQVVGAEAPLELQSGRASLGVGGGKEGDADSTSGIYGTVTNREVKVRANSDISGVADADVRLRRGATFTAWTPVPDGQEVLISLPSGSGEVEVFLRAEAEAGGIVTVSASAVSVESGKDVVLYSTGGIFTEDDNGHRLGFDRPSGRTYAGRDGLQIADSGNTPGESRIQYDASTKTVIATVTDTNGANPDTITLGSATGGGGTIDQTARNSAATAQTAADNAQTSANTAQSTANNAVQNAANAQQEVDDLEDRVDTLEASSSGPVYGKGSASGVFVTAGGTVIERVYLGGSVDFNSPFLFARLNGTNGELGAHRFGASGQSDANAIGAYIDVHIHNFTTSSRSYNVTVSFQRP